MRPNLKISPKTKSLLAALAQEAHKRRASLYLVGGAVRDFILGRKTSDLDFTVEGDPKPLAKFCGALIQAEPTVFDQFGTLSLTGAKNLRIDFATTRKESYLSPASLPIVKTPAPILEDLKRRDFTINALALPIKPSGFSELIDPFGGLSDLKSGRIQILHQKSFEDDPTRVFRAARYGARFGFDFSPDILVLAQKSLAAGYPQKLSRHRLAMELLKILGEENPNTSLKILKEWGYLDLIDPLLSQMPWPHLKGLGAETALGVLALSFGDAAERFIVSLPIDHRVSAEIQTTIKIAQKKSSPRFELPQLSRKILKNAFPALSAQSLTPVRLKAADLEALGIKPGPAMGEILNQAAQLQWSGKIKSRAEALRWAKKIRAQDKNTNGYAF